MENWEALLNFLVNNASITALIMGAVIFGLMFAIKIPLKLLTKKIANENVRDIVDRVVVLIPFGLAFLGRFLLNYANINMTEYDALTGGSLAIVLYNVIKPLFNLKKSGNKVDEIDEALSKKEIFDNLVSLVTKKDDGDDE